jgi:hypothetical protein
MQKISNVNFNGGKKHDLCFLQLDSLLVRLYALLIHKLKLQGFFLVKRFINIRRCHLQSNKLDKLNFVNKNWANDLKIGWNPLLI